MAYILAGAMTDSSERWKQSMETVTGGESATFFGVTSIVVNAPARLAARRLCGSKWVDRHRPAQRNGTQRP